VPSGMYPSNSSPINRVNNDIRSRTWLTRPEVKGGSSDEEGNSLVATDAAFAALGIDARDAAEDAESAADEVPTNVKAEPNPRLKTSKTKGPKAPRTRDGSKQAHLIAMLRRAKGAADEIVNALEWQPHTVRGAIAGALKKKRLDITLQKGAGESIESQMPAEPALSIMHAAKGSGSLGGPTP